MQEVFSELKQMGSNTNKLTTLSSSESVNNIENKKYQLHKEPIELYNENSSANSLQINVENLITSIDNGVPEKRIVSNNGMKIEKCGKKEYQLHKEPIELYNENSSTNSLQINV